MIRDGSVMQHAGLRRPPLSFRSAAAVIALLCLVSMANGQEFPPTAATPGDRPAASNNAKNDEPVIRFSRVKMPLKKIVKTLGYVPVERKQFEQLIELLEQPNGDLLSKARVESAIYEASFATGSLVEGSASLSVVNPTGKKSVLTLSPCGISVRNARSSPTAILGNDDEASRVPVGVGPNGDLVAIIDPTNDAAAPAKRTSELIFDWSLAGDLAASGVSRFALQLPPCVRTTVEILVPDDFRLSCDQGVVTNEPESFELNRWSIAAGSAGKLMVTISPAREATSDALGVAIFRQRDRVDVSPRGVDSTVNLQIDLFAAERESLTLDVDKGIRIRSIQLGDAPVRWTQTPSTEQATIAFRPALPSGSHQLQIDFTAPPPLRDVDWQLPRIHPQGIKWHSGSALVTINHPLQLADLQLSDCIQVASLLNSGSPATAPRTRAQRMEFEFHRADPMIRLRTRPQPTRVSARTGTVVTISSDESARTATATTRFESQSGQTFEIRGRIEKAWNLEDISAIPDGAMEDWSIERDSDGGRELIVRLAQPLSESAELTLEMLATQSESNSPNQVRADQLRVVEFDNVQQAPQLLAVRGLGKTRLQQTAGHEIQSLQRESLEENEQDVIDARRGDLIFRDSPGLSNLRVDVTQGLPEWEANIDVMSTLQAEAVLESFSVACRTDGVPPDQIVVQTWPRREGAITWAMQSESATNTDAAKLNGQRLTAAAQKAAGYEADVDVWVIGMPDPDVNAVYINGTRQISLPRNDDLTLSVASAPRSSKQRSTVTLTADPSARREWVVNSELSQVPRPLVPDDEQPSVFAGYLVDTSNIRRRPIELTRAVPNGQSSSGLWITKATTTAELSEAGAAICTGVYELENLGDDTINLTFSEDTVLRRAMVDEQPVLISEGLRGSELEVTLPKSSRFVQLVVEYSLNHDPLTPYSRFRWERPETDVAELSHSLKLILPSEYRPKDGRQVSPAGNPRMENETGFQYWISRWFGPLARTHLARSTALGDAATRPFDLQAADCQWECPVKDGRVSIRLYHRQSANVLGWGALLVLALSVQSLRRSKTTILVLAAVSAIAAGWVGSEWVPLCRGLMWGSFLGLAWRVLPVRRRRSGEDSIMVFRKGQVAQTAVLLLCVTIGTRVTRGQASPSFENNPSRVSLYRVLFPVDEEGEADSNFVHVPEEMYIRLLQLSQSKNPVTEQWIVNSARFAARLANAPDTDDEVATLDRLDATIQLTTFRAGTVVSLDFSTSIFGNKIGPQKAIRQLRLDGQLVDGTISDDGRSLQFATDQSGNHTLRLSMALEPVSSNGKTEIVLPLVRSADSQLELSIDRDDLEPRLITNTNQPRALDGERSVVELGAAQTARIRWRTSPLRSPLRTDDDIRQLGWLAVSPGLSQYEVRFVPLDEDSQNVVDRVRVAFDSQLKLMPYTTDDYGTAEIIESTANRRIVEVRRNADSNGLGLRFLLTNATGIGEIQLPPIEVAGANVASEWIAHSVSSTLLFDQLDREATPVIRSDFAKLWGAAINVPDFVVQREQTNRSDDTEGTNNETSDQSDANQVSPTTTAGAPPVPWAIKTYPRGSRANGDSFLVVTYDYDVAKIEYQVDVSLVEDLQFQHRLSAPPELNITDVTVKVAGARVPIRWTQSATGEIHIFVFNPTPGPHRIDVVAVMNSPKGNWNSEVALPVIALEDCDLTSVIARIRRSATARVSVIDTSVQRHTPDPNEIEDELLVATLLGDGTTPVEATVNVRDNRPQITSQILTTLRRDESTWSSEVDYACQFEGGVPDRLRFRIPDGWASSLQLDPPVRRDLVLSNAGELQLVVFPRLSEDAKSWQCKMTTPLETSQRAAMPVVLPLGNSQVDRWLQLPTQIENDRVAWDLRGTELAEPPERFPQEPNTQTFRLLNVQSSAELRRIESPAAHPNVLAEQIEIHVGDDGYSGVAIWDLDPGGTRSATLTIPDQCKLIAAAVDGQLASLVPTPDSSSGAEIRVELGGMRLAQQLRVVFTGESSGTDTEIQLAAPQLVSGGDYERLWDLTMPSSAAANKPLRFSASASRLTVDQFDRSKLASKMQTVQSPAQDTADYSPQELTAWFSRWRTQILAATEDLEPQDFSFDETSNDEFAPGDQPLSSAKVSDKLRATTYRLGISEYITRLDELKNRTSSFPTEMTGRESAGAANSASTTRVFLRTSADELLVAQPGFGAEFLQRLLMSIGLIGCFAAALQLIALPSWRGVALRWCHALVATVGIAWILWLRFPIVGGFLIAASLWWALSPGRWSVNAVSDGDRDKTSQPRQADS